MLQRRRLAAPAGGGLQVEVLHRRFGGLGRVEYVEAAPWVAITTVLAAQRPSHGSKNTGRKK